jgi:hypothetical protein
MKLLRLFSIALVALSITLVSCSGEDGATGPQGIQGEKGDTGEQGEQGEPGQDGADGVGFDELTQYGYIILEMEGTRSDNQAFQDSTSFKFTPIELDGFSKMTTADDILYTFEMRRYLSAPDDVYQQTYLEFAFEISNPGQDGQVIEEAFYSLVNYAVVGNDNKYFTLAHSYDLSNPEVISNFEITDVTFDAETNHLTFSYAFTVDAIANATGNPLNMSGMADVQLLEEVILP